MGRDGRQPLAEDSAFAGGLVAEEEAGTALEPRIPGQGRGRCESTDCASLRSRHRRAGREGSTRRTPRSRSRVRPPRSGAQFSGPSGAGCASRGPFPRDLSLVRRHRVRPQLHPRLGARVSSSRTTRRKVFRRLASHPDMEGVFTGSQPAHGDVAALRMAPAGERHDDGANL